MNFVELSTADGPCRTAIFEPPAGTATPFAAVLFFVDGAGPREAMNGMCERLAKAGYLVAQPDIFHRAAPYPADEPKQALFDGEKRKSWRERFQGPATQSAAARADAAAVFDYFASRADVRRDRYGTTGYCMGGFLSLTAAGNFPGQVAAAASFHGGGLASDAPNSPHLLVPKMKARVYVAGARDDGSFNDAMKQRLEDALTAAKVEHVIETYPALHGWCVPDFPVYDEAQAERHWAAMLDLFGRTLR